jgi:carbonic anhydrase
MTILQEILSYNRSFIQNKKYEKYQTDKFPDKRIVILSCMDTRLVELLPKAMDLRNGDFKHVKSAGAIVSHPFGSIMRSILVAIYELNAAEVMVVGHYDCGMSAINSERFLENVVKRGVRQETINVLKQAGINLDLWLRGFDDVAESVKNSVTMIKNHPLLTPDIPVHGLIIDPETGRLDLIVNGYDS